MAITVEKITELNEADRADLCQAMEDAIQDGLGFNWVAPPGRDIVENYWNGVLMVPERVLFGGRLDGTLAAAIQLVSPSKSKETSAFSARLEGHFVTPWARGHGLAKALLQAAEREAGRRGFSTVKLDVRSTQTRAITLYGENDYVEWGVLPNYEFVNGSMVAGHFFYKELKPLTELI